MTGPIDADGDADRVRRLGRRSSNGELRLSQKAQQAIKQYILEHRLEPGGLLPTEGQLTQVLGISRTAVREAVKALEALGLLEARPGVGLIVRSFSFDPILDNLAYSLLVDRTLIRDLLFVRRQLEAGAIETVARTASAGQLRVLRSLVDRMGDHAARGETFTEEDRFFHHALYAGLENPLLLKMLDVFWQVYTSLREETLGIEALASVQSWENHCAIVEALERGEPTLARAAVAAHFEVLEDRIRRSSLGVPVSWDEEAGDVTERTSEEMTERTMRG
ncbi:MAG: FadR/GntR family transcriptional regulator [Chloroflexota bacterium]